MREKAIRIALWCMIVALPLGTVVVLLLLAGLSEPGSHGTVVFTEDLSPRHNVYKSAAIATEHPKCTQIGVDVMRDLNGTAVDAAIAALLCIGVVHNHASGIGGGGIMLVRDPSGGYEVVDFRETAPRLSSRDMFVGEPDKAKVGGLAVAVPGEIAGLFYAYRRYKKVRPNGPTWRDLVGPSIDLARNGFQVSQKLHDSLQAVKEQIRTHKELAGVYLRDGEPLRAGETIKRTNLAETLQLISEDADAEADTEAIQRGAPRSFYEGPVADSLVRAVREQGGVLSLQDLKEYSVRSRAPLTSAYRQHKVVTVGPPGSGSTLIYMLNILQRFALRSMFNVTQAHWLIETMKFGYGARMGLGDVDHVPEVRDIVESMVSAESGERAAGLIDNNRTFHDPRRYTDYMQSMNAHGTTHLSVVDRFGMVVSVTSTVNLLFGSMVMDSKTGIILNDHMDDFSTPGMDNFFGIPPSRNNYIAPGKRPVSSAAPVCVERDGEPIIVSGAAGGSLITSATLLSIVGILDFALSPEAALASPRMHHQLLPDEVMIESTFAPTLEKELQKLGHKLRRLKGASYRSAVQLVTRDREGLWHAVSDPRKEGSADGF